MYGASADKKAKKDSSKKKKKAKPDTDSLFAALAIDEDGAGEAAAEAEEEEEEAPVVKSKSKSKKDKSKKGADVDVNSIFAGVCTADSHGKTRRHRLLLHWPCPCSHMCYTKRSLPSCSRQQQCPSPLHDDCAVACSQRWIWAATSPQLRRQQRRSSRGRHLLPRLPRRKTRRRRSPMWMRCLLRWPAGTRLTCVRLDMTQRRKRHRPLLCQVCWRSLGAAFAITTP